MCGDYEVTVTLRVTVDDDQALLDAAGEAVPAAARADAALAAHLALQSLIAPPDVTDLPGVRQWTGLGWHYSVEAQPVAP